MTGSMQIEYTYQAKSQKQKAIDKWKKEMNRKDHWDLIYTYYKNGKKIETSSMKNIKGNGIKKVSYTNKDEAYKDFKKFKSQEVIKVSEIGYRKITCNQPSKLIVEKEFNGDTYKYVYGIRNHKAKGKKKRGKKNAKR